MTDFKLHIVELKELAYGIVGVHVGGGGSEGEDLGGKEC